MNEVETQICTHLQDEGLGTLYERVVLSRWFRDLAARRGYASVLEYGCPITRGYDNLALIDDGLAVTVADADIARIEGGWKFPRRPAFSTLEAAPRADLVWNFAVAQLDPATVLAMRRLAQRDVLVFVPNLLNPGAPVHFVYHLLTRTPCRHAEQGSTSIRTHAGLVRLLAEGGVRVTESGYIDAPPIPDIAFSIRELKQALGFATPANGRHGPPTDPERAWRRVEMMTRFETSRFVAPLKPLVGHHIFALGTVA